MELKKAYKVLVRSQGKLYSASKGFNYEFLANSNTLTYKRLRKIGYILEYKKNEVIVPKLNNPILAFSSFKAAQYFINCTFNLSFLKSNKKHLEIWECLVEKQKKGSTYKIHPSGFDCIKSNNSNIKNLKDYNAYFPDGTIYCKKLLLVEKLKILPE
jgi:hypothetical protein